MTKESIETKHEIMIDALVRRMAYPPGAPMFPTDEGIGVSEFSVEQKKQQWRDWLKDIYVDNSFEISHF